MQIQASGRFPSPKSPNVSLHLFLHLDDTSYFNKLPFGISSAPEVFQRRMNQILEGQPGAKCLVDDSIVFGATQAEHDANLIATLERFQEANVTLNPEKCAFNKKSISILGHNYS